MNNCPNCGSMFRLTRMDGLSNGECAVCGADWPMPLDNAEARAAQAERQNEIYAAELDALAQRELRIRAERDEALMELQRIRTMLDNGTDETAIDMVKRLHGESYESRRKLEQARKVCEYWLHDARFIVANTPEHNAAVEMLKEVIK